MLSWATNQFERLSQTVAPPPEDPAGRFAYCCQRGDEDGATQLVPQLPNGMDTIVVPAKSQSPLHVSCLYSMLKLTKYLLTQPGVSVAKLDSEGNTALHCACMTSSTAGIEVVKLLVQDMQANVSQKNAAGQTPYDVASLNAIRQYLLPLQLQKETQEALANGGKGLIPGMDMGGLKVSYSGPPPPTMAGGMPPQQSPASSGTGMQPPPMAGGMPPPPIAGGMPPPPMSGAGAPHPLEGAPGAAAPTPTTTQPVEASALTTSEVPPAPSSDQHAYARTGSSSAAIYKPSSGRSYKADGFHSSSSDKRLQQKYGHASTGAYAVPPPPKSGSSTGAPPSSTGSVGALGSTSSIASSTASNPYAGGYSAFRNSGRGGGSRYVSYDAVTGAQSQVADNRGYARSSSGNYPAYAQQQMSNVAVFTPGGAPGQAQMSAVQSAPASAPMFSQPYSPQSAATQTPVLNQKLGAPQQQHPPTPGYPAAVAPTLSTTVPPTVTVGSTSAITPQNPNELAAANLFATPHPPETTAPAAPAAAVSSQGLGAPPVAMTIDNSSPTKTINSTAAPEAAAATFSSPPIASPATATSDSAATTASAFANPPAESQSGVTAEAAFASPPTDTKPTSAQETFAAPPAVVTTGPTESSQGARPESSVANTAQPGDATPATTEEITESSENFTDVPLTDPPVTSVTTPAQTQMSGGLPPPPMGFTANSSNTSAAADLFATGPQDLDS
eukprot:CAMPEP_0168723896 /NCGR_PEP_ID=MMETSP0724-20121128/3355_1 /TAXON_ID=265536 /ORGANISM="Amphiprora sp., Strain CCMP467" /LENGTH=726 /DNA_ID=CAMNT_0008770625 /DNA_START=48 /DNA_END=2228 /DNA_ORIENTATION=-